MLKREVRRGNCLALITHRVGRTDGEVLEESYTVNLGIRKIDPQTKTAE